SKRTVDSEEDPNCQNDCRASRKHAIPNLRVHKSRDVYVWRFWIRISRIYMLMSKLQRRIAQIDKINLTPLQWQPKVSVYIDFSLNIKVHVTGYQFFLI